MNILETINLIISIASGLIAVTGLVVVIVKWVLNGNAKKVLALISSIPELVKQEEQMFGSGHGADKFRWVMTMLKNQALATKTRVSDEVLGNSVNDVVDTTNNVNIDKFPFSKTESNATNNTTNQLNTENFKNNSVNTEIV
jgi:hypothetical protein